MNKCLLFFLSSINVYSNYPLLVLPQYSGGIESQINCSFRFTNVYIERTKFKELSLMNFELMFNKMNLLIGDLEDELEKEMATHSSILAWRIPWTEEPGRLQSTGSQRVGHD